MDISTYEAILHSITALTVIFQVYILYLINWQSSKIMQNYTFYLNYFVLWDLTFTIALGSFFQPDPTGRLLSVTVHGLAANTDPKVQMFTASVVIVCGSNMLLSQDFCLLYRFAAIREDRHLHEALTRGRAKMVMILFGQSLSLMVGFFIFQLFVPPEELSVLPEFLNYFRSDQFALWVDLNSRLTRIFTVVALSLLLVSEGFCFILIYAILSKLPTQLATPLLLVVIPITIRLVNVVSSGTSKVSPDVSRFGFIFLTFYGLSNSILTIGFVAPFRNYTYNQLIYPWLRPMFSVMGIESLAPRRKSLIWNSSTNYNQNRRLTIVKSTIFAVN